MPRRRASSARTPEARESEMINLAMIQAEEQLRNGKASPLIVAHFLKLGTARSNLELKRLEADTKLALAKADFMESQKRSDEIAEEAIKAFKSYSPTPYDNDEDFDEYDEYYDED